MNINKDSNLEEKNDSKDYSSTNLKKEAENIEGIDNSITDEDYKIGWNKYSEITNGRFAMLGFFAILLIEVLSNKSFLQWAGIIN